MRRQNKNLILAVTLCACLLSGIASAETVWWDTDGAEWQDTLWFPHKDDPSYLPGGSDEANIGHSKTGYVNSSGNSINKLNLGAAGTGGNALHIQGGGLTVNDLVSLKSADSPDLLEVSGGAFYVENWVNIYNSASVLQIIGSGCTLTGGAHVNNGGTVEFVVDETGITTMPWNVGDFGGGTISLVSDGAAAGVYDLFDGSVDGNLAVVLDNPANWDTSNLLVDGTVTYVPEPATLAVLGLGSLFLRRRKP